jgi:hypothetical protein
VQRSDVVREALMRALFKHPATMSGPVKRERGGEEREEADDENEQRDDSRQSA